MGTMKKISMLMLVTMLLFTSGFDFVNVERSLSYEDTNEQNKKKGDGNLVGSVSNNDSKKILLAGYDFSGVIMENGDVWTWGANESYQLGLKDTENRIYPVRQDKKLNHKNIEKVISTDGTTHVLMNNGDVYRWGKSGPLQGGLSVPTKIVGNVSDVAHTRVQALTNPHDSMAFVENGEVKVYGSGYQGQRGRGIASYGAAEVCSTAYSVSIGQRKPVLKSGTIESCASNPNWKTVKNEVPLTNVRMVEGSTSSRVFVAVTNDNEIYTWGQNYSNFANKNTNVKIEDKIMKLAVGSKIYALTENGDLWEWNGGNGIPLKSKVQNVKDIQVQANTALVLTKDGVVYGRGNNRDGQLGDLSKDVKEFTKIKDNIREIGLGSHHSLFEDNDGKIFGQGWNGYRQLANENDGVKEEFTKIPNLSNVTHISSEIYSSFAIKNNRDLLAWGELKGETFGDNINLPREIRTFDSDVLTLDSNSEETTVLTGVLLENNKAYVWGHNYDDYDGHGGLVYSIGELRHNPNNAAYTPNTVNGVTYVVEDLIGSSDSDLLIKDVIPGGYGGAAINLKGQLLSWGSNNGGLWGIGERHLKDAGSRGVIPKTSRAFVRVKSNEKFIGVNGMSKTRLALQEMGYVYSWGHDINGSLGRGGDSFYPMRIEGLNNIKEISMGYFTGMALDDKGNLYSWGQNHKGQVGDGTVSPSKGIVNISGLSNVKFENIFSGRTSQFATTKEGDLYAWGDNRYGQLGLGGRFDRTSPRKVEGLPGPVTQVDNGEEHTIVLLENGDVYVAGADTFGQLGLEAKRSSVGYQEIPFPDYITLNTKDNTEKTMGENLDIDGYVTSVIPGNPLEIRYEVESPSGVIERGKISDTVSMTESNPFSKRIILDDKYTIGGYTINVTVKNKLSNIENTQTINFGVIDNIPPESPEISVNTNWTNENVSVQIADGVDNESGVDYTEYKVNQDDWVRYTKPFVISLEGVNTLESRTIDKAGNRGASALKTVRIDKTPPAMTIKPNITSETHKNVILNIEVSDDASGIKSITYLGENMIKNGDFKNGRDGWTNQKDTLGNESEGIIEQRNGNLLLQSKVSRNKAKQEEAFQGSTVGAEYYAEVTAKGVGKLNARYGASGGVIQEDYTQIVDDEYNFNVYRFKMERGEWNNDQFMIEKVDPIGWLEIKEVRVFAQKDITNSKAVEVTKNGKHTFVVEDNAGNITTKEYYVDNIVRELTFVAPEVDDDIKLNIDDKMSKSTPISNIEITDWRDEVDNNWKLSVEASKLTGASNMPSGVISISGVESVSRKDGSGRAPDVVMKDESIIDDGSVPLVSGVDARGVYDVKFDTGALKFSFNPGNVKKGKYSTRLIWTLEATP